MKPYEIIKNYLEIKNDFERAKKNLEYFKKKLISSELQMHSKNLFNSIDKYHSAIKKIYQLESDYNIGHFSENTDNQEEGINKIETIKNELI